MTLQQRMYELTAVEEVDAFLEKFPTSAIFKAGGCHKTMQGFGAVEQALKSQNDLHMAFVRVIESRPVSNYIAELTGITHQSPQFILMVDKMPVYDVDNWNINQQVVEAALEQHLGELENHLNQAPSPTSSKTSDFTPYITLLDALLSGNLNEEEFEKQWLSTFQMDATLRSTEDFALINSLYGDVDAAIASRANVEDGSSSLKLVVGNSPFIQIAEKLLHRLKTA